MKKTDIAIMLFKATKEAGVYKDIMLYLRLLNKVKEAMDESELNDFSQRCEKIIDLNFPAKIKKIIEDYFGISDISIKNKMRKYAHARMMYAYFCMKIKDEKFNEVPIRIIANHINRNHATIIYGNERIKDLLSIKDEVALFDVKNLNNLINFEL